MAESGARPTLIIVCGLPGAGKTTHAKQIQLERRAVRLCADDWMNALSVNLYDAAARASIEALQWQLAQELLRHPLTVIIEWGTWAKAERDTLRVAARALGAAVELHFLSAPVEMLFERIRRRGIEHPPIEIEQLKEWAATFETPTPDEFALFDKTVVNVSE